MPNDLDLQTLLCNARRVVEILVRQDKSELSKLWKRSTVENLLNELNRYPRKITGVAPDFGDDLDRLLFINNRQRFVQLDVELWAGEERTDLTLQLRSQLGTNSELEIWDLLVM